MRHSKALAPLRIIWTAGILFCSIVLIDATVVFANEQGRINSSEKRVIAKYLDPKIIIELIEKAGKLKSVGNLKGAILIWESLLAYAENNGQSHSSVVISLNNLGNLYAEQGFYDKAEALFVRSLTISEKHLRKEPAYIGSAMAYLADLYIEKGLYGKAEPLLMRALAISENSLGPMHPDTGACLNSIANLYSIQGLHGKAEKFYVKALGISENILGRDHGYTAIALNNLALTYVNQSQYGKAEPLFLRALEIHRKGLAGERLGEASTLNNLALMYTKQGLYSKAEPIFEKSLEIFVVSFGRQHVEVSRVLNNLAELYSRQELNAKAASYYMQALAIREKELGEDSPVTIDTLSNLAGLYFRQGLFGKAEQLNVRVLAIRQKVFGFEHPDTALSINNLAALYHEQGLYGKAEPLYKRALATSQRLLGPVHPDTAASINSLAELYLDQGLREKAEELFRRSIRIESVLIQQESPFLLLGEREAYRRSIDLAAQFTFTLAYHQPMGANLALFSRLNRQGLLEDIEKRQAQLATLPGQQQEVAEQLRAINKQISSLSLTPQQRKAFKIRQEQLEAQLYRLLPELKPRIVEVQQVAAALPSTGALVEYQRYQPFDGKKPRTQRWGKPRYLALVLKANGTVAAIDLGSAAVIEERIQQALRATQEQLSDANQLWGQVGKQVLDPLAPALAGVQTLFVSPDGELNRIPFAALPAPGGKSLLADALQLRLLTTGRELLDLAQPRSQAKSAALVVANPAFDQLASNASVPAVRPADPVEPPFGIGGQQRSADLATLRWAALPGTAKEGQAIAALTGATLLSGSQASATAIEKQAAPRILHIASHGYFLANQPASPPGKRSSSNSGLPPMGSLPAANLQAESPLLRSGIVLAGANKASAGASLSNSDRGDDGYLTALEITQLDWKGTELVVISACESGKGDIQAGEGVYGLKRAIAVAGARSSLLSLWKVDDAATAAFMQSFYVKLKSGQGRADALGATQKEFRNHSIPGWRHPYVWAAFQLSGDWGPIPGI